MKVQNSSDWATSIQSSVQNVISNTRLGGTFASYHSETNMIYFFDRGKENPSVAKIIANDEIRKGGIFAKIRFFNKYYSDKLTYYRQLFEDGYTKLYPKTGTLRTHLINNNRIVMDKIQSKASKLEKFLMFSKL